MRLALALLLVPVVALAAPVAKPVPPAAKPAAPAKPVSEDQLFADLKKCESAEDAHPIEEKLQNFFRISNSPSVDLLMSRVHAEQGAASDDASKTAKKLIEAVTRIAPGYAEGWHVKAAMEAAANDDANALISLQKTVQLNPRHFQAMVELGEMVEDYGDKKTALGLYRRALALDPQHEEAKRKVRELTVSVEGRDI
jgi:tetratricopeptide (TPR) repeat protein